jgi:hypothetical protein
MTTAKTHPLTYIRHRQAPPRELPPEFSDLQPWIAEWALPHERDRMQKLIAIDIETLRPFYDAMLARMPAIRHYLDHFSLNAMPPEAATLFDMALTFMETAHPIDLGWKTTDIEDKFPHERFLVKSNF